MGNPVPSSLPWLWQEDSARQQGLSLRLPRVNELRAMQVRGDLRWKPQSFSPSNLRRVKLSGPLDSFGHTGQPWFSMEGVLQRAITAKRWGSLRAISEARGGPPTAPTLRPLLPR